MAQTNLIEQTCTRFLHACSALCKCANWLCRTCTPHHTAAGRSSVSLTQSPFAFPSNCRRGPPLTSYMAGRDVPSRARHSSTHHRTLCAVHGLCTSVIEVSLVPPDKYPNGNSIRPGPFPSEVLPVHYSSIILPFDGIQSEVLTAPQHIATKTRYRSSQGII
jgi:hypothetical protein